MKKEGTPYYIIFAYDTDSDFAGRYSIIYDRNKDEAIKRACKIYGYYIVHSVLTVEMFERANYVKAYGFELKDTIPLEVRDVKPNQRV